MDSERERDIQSLCSQVIANAVTEEYNPNGPDYFICKFCYNREPSMDASKLVHDADCAYLIAKDLSSGTAEKATSTNTSGDDLLHIVP